MPNRGFAGNLLDDKTIPGYPENPGLDAVPLAWSMVRSNPKEFDIGRSVRLIERELHFLWKGLIGQGQVDDGWLVFWPGNGFLGENEGVGVALEEPRPGSPVPPEEKWTLPAQPGCYGCRALC